MNTQELATEYGVPMPETCKELGWRPKTYWYWNSSGGLSSQEDIALLESAITLKHVTPAPQFHEIWNKLPKKIKDDEGTIFDLEISHDVIRYEHDFWVPRYKVEIQNSNFAQAAAELYLMLKKDGKL